MDYFSLLTSNIEISLADQKKNNEITLMGRFISGEGENYTILQRYGIGIWSSNEEKSMITILKRMYVVLSIRRIYNCNSFECVTKNDYTFRSHFLSVLRLEYYEMLLNIG